MPASATPTCALCGLPVGDDPVRGAGAFADRVYCCAGCARVDEVVAGLPEEARAATIQALAERLGIAPRRSVRDRLAATSGAGTEPRPSGRGVDGAADRGLKPAVRQVRAGEASSSAADCDAPPGAVVEEHFRLTGMHCPSCAWLAERLLESRPGVSGARVDFLTETATARLDLRRVSRADAFAVLAEAGYRAAPLDAAAGATDGLTLRLAVAAIAAMNAMMLAWVHYVGLFGASAGAAKPWIGALQAAIVLPVVVWAGAPIFRRAFGLARLGRMGMESLLALGIGASLLLSFGGFVLPGADFYFEIPAMVTASALGSQAFERWIRRSGARRVAELLRPRAVRVRLADPAGGDGPPRYARVDELRPGDRVVVPDGDEVPADVAVIGTTAAVDEALLTGEPTPLVRRAGATVLAGSRVVGEPLVGEVLRPASESAHAQIGRQVLDLLASERARPAAADRIAAVFVPAIVLAALGSVVVRVLGGAAAGSSAVWLPAVAVLVVACPCAFSIAASAALGAAALRLLRDGVLVRDPAALDAAAGADTVVFDKTGTLTVGDMDVREVRGEADALAALLPAVAALEARSRHPAGLAVRRFLAARGVVPAPAEAVEELPGQGVRGTVDGAPLAVGAPALFAEGLAAAADGAETLVLFGRPPRAAGAFVLADPLRAGAAEAVARLRRDGLDVRLLSGDGDAVVERVAREAGIADGEGHASPGTKAERVGTLRAAGRRVLYVGDGVNDAPALAAADVGLAMRHGAGMACEVAGLVAVRDDPAAAGSVVEVARRLGRVTRQNYAWAIGYNAVLVPLAALGLLHPAIAALAMFCSSASVLANSARLLRRRS